MGILYSITPLTQYVTEADKSWLSVIGFTLPSRISTSRNPTAKDLRVVLDSLDGYQVNYHVDDWSWTAEIIEKARPDGPEWTILHLSDFDGNEDLPQQAFAETGSETLVVMIAERLSRICGPLVIDDDIDGAPLLITPGVDSRIAIQSWRDISRRIEVLTRLGYSSSK